MTGRDRVAVFLVVVGLGILATSGNLRSADYVSAFSVARNLVESGSVEATPIQGFETWAVTPGPDGKPYCRYGLAHSLLAVPGVVAGRALAGVWPGGSEAFDLVRLRFYPLDETTVVLQAFCATLVNPLLLGILAVAVLGLGQGLGLSRRHALGAALLAGLGSPLFFQGSDLTAEPASALLIALAAMALLPPGVEGRLPGIFPVGRALAAGLSMGLCVTLKVAHGILLIPAGLAVLAACRAWRGEWRIRDSITASISFLLGTLPGLLLVVGYNIARFGTPFETGYGHYATAFTNPFWEGAIGQWVSPGRGLVFHFPAVIMALAGARRMVRESIPVAVLAFGSLAALWLLYSPWFAWDGGWTYGPRLLSPATALLAIPALMALSGARSIPATMLWKTLLAVTFVASFLGFAVDYIDYGYFLWKVNGDATEFVMRWSIPDAPLAAWWTFPVRRVPLLAGVIRAGFPWPLVLVIGGAAVSLVSGLALLIRGRSDSTGVGG
jgi:hypothetical protein